MLYGSLNYEFNINVQIYDTVDAFIAVTKRSV